MEFWEENFAEKKEMWGFEPAKSALLANDFFVEKSLKNILIPGVGYGRNAKVFIDNNIDVTGIEISSTAIDLSKKHYGDKLTIYHGSVLDMPFDTVKYDGVFCYALVHLLDRNDRKKLIQNCYKQLVNNGYMIFTAITKDAQTYGQGVCIDKDTYRMFGGVDMFFYDRDSIEEEFGGVGLFEISEVRENYPFYFIKCKKEEV